MKTNFTKLQNQFIDEYLSILSGNSIKCYIFILRKTTGWNKKKDSISIAQISKNTGIKKPHTIHKSLKELEEIGLIKCQKSTGKTSIIEVLNQCLKRAVPKKGTSAENGHIPVPKKGTTTSAENGHTTKETIKETVLKEKEKGYPDELNIEAWELWEQHKKEKKQAYKPTGRKQAIKKLAQLPKDKQLDCIELSITNNWAGFFIDKFKVEQNEENTKRTDNGEHPYFEQQAEADRQMLEHLARSNNRTVADDETILSDVVA